MTNKPTYKTILLPTEKGLIHNMSQKPKAYWLTMKECESVETFKSQPHTLYVVRNEDPEEEKYFLINDKHGSPLFVAKFKRMIGSNFLFARYIFMKDDKEFSAGINNIVGKIIATTSDELIKDGITEVDYDSLKRYVECCCKWNEVNVEVNPYGMISKLKIFPKKISKEPIGILKTPPISENDKERLEKIMKESNLQHSIIFPSNTKMTWIGPGEKFKRIREFIEKQRRIGYEEGYDEAINII